MSSKLFLYLMLAIFLPLSGIVTPAIADKPAADTTKAADGADTPDGITLHLVRGVVCETIEDYEPRNIAVAFPISTGRISCYTSFDSVSKVIIVEHRWFRREELVTTKRLTLKPPSWATYSSIQLREADKGPWKIEIRQVDGPMFKTIRFSVTD